MVEIEGTDTGVMHYLSAGERTDKHLAVTRVIRWDDATSHGWYAELNDPPMFCGRDSEMFYPDHMFEFVAEGC